MERVDALLAELKAQDLVHAQAAAVDMVHPAILAFATTVTDITLRRVFLQDYANNLEVILGHKCPPNFCDEFLLIMHKMRPGTYYNGSRREVLIADDVKRLTP